MAPSALVVFALIAASHAVAVVADPQGPTYDTWKETQANESAEIAANVSKQKKMAAVDKVVQLLDDLRTKVLNEGEEEAATYNKFSCFCKDTSTEKTAAIQRGTDDKASLETEIGQLQVKRDGLDTTIKGLMETIETEEGNMRVAEETRSKELKLYNTNAADLRAALEALEGAIQSLKASRKPSLLQVKKANGMLRRAVELAEVLGLSSSPKALSFLQQAPEVQMEDYKFHSEDIIKTLEKLLDDFRKEKITVDEAEVKTAAAHDVYMQTTTRLVEQKNRELEDAKKEKATTVENIAASSQQLTTVAATLLDDQQYLKDLAQMCSDKAKTWTQRTTVRANELSTLTEVLKVIKSKITEKTTAATVRLAQKAISVHVGRVVASSDPAMEAVEAEAEMAEAGPAFLQFGRESAALRRRSLRGEPAADGRAAIADLLLRRGKDLKSTLLTSLASKIAADPFAKVKVLIQELLERLLEQAGKEADHKAWCDQATTDAEQKRDYAAKEVASLNGQMANLEALIDKLTEELAVLNKEIKAIEDERKKAEDLRKEESQENAATVEEAKQGLKALNLVVDTLSKFYKTVAKEKVDLSLAQQDPASDAPDAGFANGEAYLGSQAEATGILGLLEVMGSDFQRTISDTEAAEEQAEQEHLAFMTESGKSLAEKNEAKGARDTQKLAAEQKFGTAQDSMTEQSAILTGKIKELLELKPACVDTGMSYADRVANRKDEIEALKKALCILGAYEQYGPEGLKDAC